MFIIDMFSLRLVIRTVTTVFAWTYSHARSSTHQLSPFHTFFENEGVREREKDFTFIEIQFRPSQCSQQTLDRTIDIPRLLTPIHTSEILYSISRVGEGMCYLISILYSQYPFPAQLPRQQVIV